MYIFIQTFIMNASHVVAMIVQYSETSTRMLDSKDKVIAKCHLVKCSLFKKHRKSTFIPCFTNHHNSHLYLSIFDTRLDQLE